MTGKNPKHAKRGHMAKKAKLFADVMEAVELLVVADCPTIDQLREKFKAGTFDSNDWLATSLAKYCGDIPMTPALRRSVTRKLSVDYRRRMATLLNEQQTMPRGRS